jgi:DNA-binding CsgD family transcriptional regulator
LAASSVDRAGAGDSGILLRKGEAALEASEPGARDPGTAGATPLTPRQAEVVKLAQRGLSAKEIARHLGISKRTVEHHLSTARQRTGVANTVALVGKMFLVNIEIPNESCDFCSQNVGFSEQLSTAIVPVPQLGRRRGRPKVMTDDMIAKARLLLSSHTISDIARTLGVSRTTLYAHMKEIRQDAPRSR